MRILFATAWPLRQGPAGPTSELASARYRVVMPARQLSRMGHEVAVATLPPGGWPKALLDTPRDVVVVSKSFHADNEALAAAARERGMRVVVDLCDDHFEHPKYGAHFHNLATLAGQVVANTPEMAASVLRHTGREALVIGDPVEGPRRAPAFAPRFPALRITWFGHPGNLDGVAARGAELVRLSQRMRVRLTVVTTPAPEVTALLTDIANANPAGIQVALVAWSPEATWKAIEDADLVWIPSTDETQKSVKSANRLTESLWGGRVVVADALPAYRPYADLTPVGVPLDEAVARLLEDKGVEARLKEAQRRIAATCSDLRIGRLWAHAVGDASPRPLRLNLGCGDKILPGYVNVDVVEARAGMKPDVICDLHELSPFESDSADEILSVHVIEHFWRWEVVDVVREWVRVLKPGGRMVVECPNVASACAVFAQDPQSSAYEDQRGQRTMWVLYGDPAWKDPLMIHRWGYTPESLKRVLAEAGLTQLRQEPAQFKQREPRDMRITGVKPA
jgi:SAM-dependent methyltransferase